MLLIACPYCGERPEIEFRYAGEAHIARASEPSRLDDRQWAEYLYIRSNRKGLHHERWVHVHGCGRFFNAMRHTFSDVFVATYRIGERPPQAEPASDGAQ